MRSRKLFILALASSALFFGAPEAQAQADRPDIPDLGFTGVAVQNSIVAPATDDDSNVAVYVTQQLVTFFNRNTYIFAYAARNVIGPNNGFMLLNLYEPDKIQRKADKTSLKQKTFVTGYVAFSTAATGGFASIATANAAAVDCKGQVKLEHSNVGVISAFKWNFQCKEAVITSLGFSPAQLLALEAVFGTAKKLKLSNKSP